MVDDDAEVYRRYAGDLIRFATALVGPHDAEDVLATAVVHALATPRWVHVDNRRAYLYRAILHEASKLRRSARRRRAREERAATPGSVEQVAGDVDVLVALRGLSERQRAVVFLTYWADLDVAAVAAELGVSVRTVERELTASRAMLARRLS
ncbi:MAG: putative polymerase subfamily sigma factor [Ilumatobacteraceae bacterium]|nr:putative polymerase subfamily sigma factor [Ilumatobacteraceae bacterium]